MLFSLCTALAWDLDPGVLQASELDLAGIDCVDADGLRCVVPNGFTVAVLSPDATLLATYPREASDLAWLPDQSAFVLCSPEGTFSVAWEETDFGSETLLLDEGCTEATRSDGAVVFIAAGTVYRTDGQTAVVLFEASGHDQIAADDALLVTGGGGSITVHSTPPETVSLPAELGDIALSGGVAYVASTSGDIADGAGLALELNGSIAGNVDLDGDGTGDLVVKTADQLIVRGSFDGILRVFELPGEATVVGVTTTEACDDLIVGYIDGIQRVFVDACLGDADGDGVTTEAGDCNDSDFSIAPGATEVCNDIDEDCDGQIGDVQLRLMGPESADEGDTISVTWQTCGELPALTVTPAGTCDAVEGTCVLPDDGVFTVQLTPADAPEAAETIEVTVSNVRPTLETRSFTTDPIPQSGIQLEASDPGDDEISFRLVEGPDFTTLAANGLLTITDPKEGTFDLTIELDDGDGGIQVSSFSLIVGDPDKNQGGCLCATSAAIPGGFALLLVLLGLRRRP